jgi:hypothetical protein
MKYRQPLEHCDPGFELHARHVYLSVYPVFVLCCIDGGGVLQTVYKSDSFRINSEWAKARDFIP